MASTKLNPTTTLLDITIQYLGGWKFRKKKPFQTNLSLLLRVYVDGGERLHPGKHQSLRGFDHNTMRC